MGSNYPVHVTCVFATHNNNEPTMPRFGRVNKRYTYSIHGTASGYRLIGDVKRRLQWIKKHADLHDSLPGNLFTEVQMIFRSFGYTEELSYIFVAPNKLPSGEERGRVFIAVKENGMTERLSVGEVIRKTNYVA